MEKIALIALCLLGCGTKESPADLSVDVLDAASCTVKLGLGNAPALLPTITLGAPPVATGGTIVDGDYQLTTETLYADTLDMMFPQASFIGALRFRSGTFAESLSVLGAETDESGSFSTNGNQLSLVSCTHQSSLVGYSATAAGVTLFATSETGVTGVSDYTKQ